MSEHRDISIFFDEAGNTGQNLVDHEQPVFCLASMLLDETNTPPLASVFQGLRSSEIHFSRLRRSRIGRERILAFLNHPTITPEVVKLTILHKPFAITASIVEYLLEPLAFEEDVDLYERGANISLANLLNIVIPTTCGKSNYSMLQEAFVQMARSKGQREIDAFYRVVQALIDQCVLEKAKGFLAAIAASEKIIHDVLRNFRTTSIDPAITSFFLHCSEWTGQLQSPFRIIHDESKPLKADLEMLKRFMDPDAQPIEYGYDYRKAFLPLSVQDVEFEESTGGIELQLADVVASAAALFFKSKLANRSDDFVNAIDSSKLMSLLFWGIWPSDRITPQELGTEEVGGKNLVNQMAAMLARNPTGGRA